MFAGIGCRRICPPEEIAALVRRAGDEAGCVPSFLAAPAFKRETAALAAALLGLDLVLVDGALLAAAQSRCVTHSAAALLAVSVASVAEGSALAAAGPGGRLLLPRIASAAATCALAIAP